MNVHDVLCDAVDRVHAHSCAWVALAQATGQDDGLLHEASRALLEANGAEYVDGPFSVTEWNDGLSQDEVLSGFRRAIEATDPATVTTRLVTL